MNYITPSPNKEEPDINRINIISPDNNYLSPLSQHSPRQYRRLENDEYSRSDHSSNESLERSPHMNRRAVSCMGADISGLVRRVKNMRVAMTPETCVWLYGSKRADNSKIQEYYYDDNEDDEYWQNRKPSCFSLSSLLSPSKEKSPQIGTRLWEVILCFKTKSMGQTAFKMTSSKNQLSEKLYIKIIVLNILFSWKNILLFETK